MDEVGSDARLEEIASQFSELEYVEAMALAGSATGGALDSQSDFESYYDYETSDPPYFCPFAVSCG